ncbi:MAG: acetyl-CoA acetyltransferase [Caulobacteraceae bacterium]|nr:acetyl-CoA acetyltransferase [Caulobacteraceae bacterium]
MAGPLDGLRILDMTTVVMGPYAAQILGDLGADVIKIEAPGGDSTRKIPPMRNADMGYQYLHMNRNKRSIVIDLKQPEGREALVALVRESDAIVSNIRPAALKRLGLGYDDLKTINPKIVSVALVGFDPAGPYADRPAYEDLIQGLTAIPSILIDAGSPTPHYVPVTFNDRGVGLNACIVLLSALLHRAKTGEGQEIVLPMFETMVQQVMSDHMGGYTFDPQDGPAGYARTLTKERRPYETKDGWICTIVYTDNHWRSFMRLIGQEALMATDPRLKNISTRTVHASELYAFISDAMLEKTTAEWLEILIAADVPATPLHTLDTLIEDPHLKATGFFKIVEHPTEGPIREMSIPSKWSTATPSVRRRAPQLGENSREIMRELGVSDDKIDDLIARGILNTGQ